MHTTDHCLESREDPACVWNKAGHGDGPPVCSPAGRAWLALDGTGGDSPGQLPMPRASPEGQHSDRRPTLPGAEEVPTTEDVQLQTGEASHREREELVTSCFQPRPTRVSSPLDLHGFPSVSVLLRGPGSRGSLARALTCTRSARGQAHACFGGKMSPLFPLSLADRTTAWTAERTAADSDRFQDPRVCRAPALVRTDPGHTSPYDLTGLLVRPRLCFLRFDDTSCRSGDSMQRGFA